VIWQKHSGAREQGIYYSI